MLVAAVALMLSGCGDSNVQTVKQTSLSLDKSISIGNALDNRKICSNVSWSETKDERGRVIVGYLCEIPVSYINDTIQQDAKTYVEKELFGLMNNRRSVSYKIDELNKQLENISEKRDILIKFEKLDESASFAETLAKLDAAIKLEYPNEKIKYEIYPWGMFDVYIGENKIDPDTKLSNSLEPIFRQVLKDYESVVKLLNKLQPNTNNILSECAFTKINTTYSNSCDLDSQIANLKREISDYEKVVNEDYKKSVAKLQFLIDTSASIKATSINQYVNFSVVGSEVQPYSCYFEIKANEDISLSYLNPYDCLRFAYLSNLNDSFAKQLQSFTFDILDSYVNPEVDEK